MAYAAVISLKRTIHRLENSINKPQITKSACQELDSLRSRLEELDDERSRMVDRRVIDELDTKIREAVWKVEDVLESFHSLNISSSQGDGERSYSAIPLVDEIEMEMEMEMDLFSKKVKMLVREYYVVLWQNTLPAEGEDEAVQPVNKSTTVGSSDLPDKIRNELLHGYNELKIVSLVGMAGIGKTHLATDIYHHPLIVQHFHSRVWVNVGPKYRSDNIRVDIVAQIVGKPRDLFKKEHVVILSNLIESKLHGRRILIVLDDLWSSEAFYSVMGLFPELENGSRVLMTTRIQEATRDDWNKYWNRSHNEMSFLNNEESWNLLWQNVFVAEKSFPPQLEKPGRKIAENCEGLPLLILTVANILCGLEKTKEYWEMVAEKKTTTFTDAYDQIYEVLLTSYDYLPQRLKACFLYMGVFPQTYQIPASKLINLWGVEDFLEPGWRQKLKGLGMEYLQDLVSKSLAIICKWSFETVKRIKSSKLHSAYWYLCVTEARKNKLFHVLNKLNDVISIESPRRLSVQNNILLGLKELYDSMAAAASTTRSLLCTGEDHQYPVRICFNMMLLIRVLDALAIRFYEFPDEVLKLLQLRYLSLTHNGELPSSISNLQWLQCLILRRHHNIIKLVHTDSIRLPEEIWKMPVLRHVRIMGSNLPDPSKGEELRKLLTLYVNAQSCTEAVFRSIPKLKKLGITIELEPDTAAETVRCFEHIKVLHGLKSVKCVVVNPRLRSQLGVAPPDHLLYFPRGLTKLSLNGLGYSWKHMTAIGSLKYLKALKLRCSAFQGPEWETEAGQFRRLEFLLLEDVDLVHWTAEGICFRNLGHLSVRHCYKLKKIRCRFLKMLEIDDCSPSVVDSAQQIKLKKKKSQLQVVINSSWNLP